MKVNKYICQAPAVFTGDAFYIVGGKESKYGGSIGTNSNTIGRLDAFMKVWSQAGSLINARSEHSAIYYASSLMVVGGFSGQFSTEKCTINETQVTCVEQDPKLIDYYGYPALFLVPSDFCQSSL